nr:MAG TPA: Tail fiber protein [Caudoviricetes sp.]
MSNPIFIARQDTLEQEILPAHWLSQYKLFGEESYTFQDKEIWKKFCMSRAAANDRDMHAEALEEMLTTFSAEHTGKWMLTVYGMDAAVLEGLASMAAVAGNGTAMAAVAANALLMHAITNSETAMDAIGTSRIARDAVQASPYYNSYIKENDMAIAKLVVALASLESAGYSGMAGVAADSTAMTAVAASSTAMTAVVASSTAMTAVAASATAMGKIAAVDAALSKLAASTTAMDALYARKKQMKGGSASKSGKFIILEISQSNAFNTSKYGYATLSDGSKPDWSSYLAKYAFFQKYPKYATYMLNDTDSDDYIYYFDIASP